uniref:TBC1 domain family, member 25 n=1 Tax=Cyprinus carpio TaxID=7962 RepID=A0A8C2FXJ9_CYPCA
VICISEDGKCEGVLPAEFRSFAVDPQITSLEVLQHILIRAFELNGKRNFGISYLSRDRGGVEVYVSLLSDWDLDAAFVSAAKPFLQLKMDIKPSEDSPVLEDWDIISPKDVIGSDQLLGEKRSLASAALPFTQSLLSQVGRTLSRVQQALSWSYGEEVKPFKPPLSDAEFHSYLNSQGQLTRPEDLRLRIYHGGVEPSLRKDVHQNVDMEEMEDKQKERQRRRHMLRPSREEADGVRSLIEEEEEKGPRKEGEGEYGVDDMVKNDVTAPAPSFEKQASFGEFKYYSGRSEDSFDINENDCSDPTLSPVQFQSAHSTLPFSVRQSTEESEGDPGEQEPLIGNHTPSSPGQRDSPNGQAASPASSLPSGLPNWKSSSYHSPEASNSPSSWRTASPDDLSKCISSSSSGDKAVSPDKPPGRFTSSQAVINETGAQSPSVVPGKSLLGSPSQSSSRSRLSSPVLSFGKSPSLPKAFSSNLPSPCRPTGSGITSPNTNKPEGGGIKPCSLPPPQEFGKGNPFMLFLCLSILLEHRDHIVKNSLDYNELAMHFDRLVRRHNLGRILQRAKALFADYLQSEVWDSEEGDEVSLDSPTTAATSPQTPTTRPPFLNVQPSQGTLPNSTYNLADTIPSPKTPVALSPSDS